MSPKLGRLYPARGLARTECASDYAAATGTVAEAPRGLPLEQRQKDVVDEMVYVRVVHDLASGETVHEQHGWSDFLNEIGITGGRQLAALNRPGHDQSGPGFLRLEHLPQFGREFRVRPHRHHQRGEQWAFLASHRG